MNKFRVFVGATIIFVSVGVNAGNICGPGEASSSELQIKEDELTLKRFDWALILLETIDSEKYSNYDEIHFGMMLHNALLVVEGYALKVKAERDKNDEYFAKQVFCSWLKKARRSD